MSLTLTTGFVNKLILVFKIKNHNVNLFKIMVRVLFFFY